jgi:hypothetical protein
VTTAAYYDVTVDFSNNMTEMVVNNFYNKFTVPLNVRVKGDTMFIPQQTIMDHEIKGIGYLKDHKYYGDHAKLEMHYSIKLPDGRTNDFGLSSPYGKESEWTK